MESVILASSSRLRQNFFRLLGLPFTVMPPEIDETPKGGAGPRQAAEDLAMRKIMAVVKKNEELGMRNEKASPSFPRWVFGADTIVVLEGDMLGKPENRDAAKKMLGCLSGRRHEVITAMALYNAPEKKADCRSVTCEVNFAPLSPAEIEWYLETGEWQGAAGGYQIQSLGGCLVKSISGSPSAVAGLPLHDFYAMLRDNGYRFGA